MGIRRWVPRKLWAVAALLVAAAAVVPAPNVGADGNEASGNPVLLRRLTAGGNQSCVLLTNGTVRCWGAGLSDTASEPVDHIATVALGTGRTATSISAGTAHTCALLDNATVKCWGDNALGQLGLGDKTARPLSSTVGSEAWNSRDLKSRPH